MRKGQSNIIIFPILIMIIVAAWFLSTTSIFTLTTESHAAFVEMSERQKAFMDASIEHDQLPTPVSNEGIVENTGLVALTDVIAYHISNQINKTTLSPIFFQGDTLDYFLDNPEYGDILIVKSRESFWGTTIVPRVRYANAALRIGTFAGENQAVIETASSVPTSTYYLVGNLNQDLENALEEANDSIYYTLAKNKQAELWWDVGDECLALAIQLQLNALNNGTSTRTVDIQPWNGNDFTTVYECTYPVGYTECYTPDLSGDMVQDGTIFKIRIMTSGTDVWFDYARLRAKCVK
ncbi:MAG: hypothetical protein J7K68_00625 [Candidatus Diapherotrites archaeon]|nr:hypothetical protein [Candidatus Diapherotrites archaeon]